MPEKFSLTVRGRRLLRDLRAIRDSLGLTPEDVAGRVGWHRSKMYRIEKGESRLILNDLYALLDVYEVGSPRHEALVQLGRDAWKRGWWLAYADLYANGGGYFVVEDSASAITFQSLHLLPGLFQTENYAHALIHATHPDEDDAANTRRVQARLARQQLLTRDPAPAVTAILDEAILHRQVGSTDITRAQLHRLGDLAERPNITIRVVPYTAGAHAGIDGQFTILRFPDDEDPDLVFQEGLFGDVWIESTQDVARYTRAANDALNAALTPEQSIAMINKVADGIR